MIKVIKLYVDIKLRRFIIEVYLLEVAILFQILLMVVQIATSQKKIIMKKTFVTDTTEEVESQVMEILRKAYLKMVKLENFDKYSFPFYLLRTAIVELYTKHDADFASEIIQETWFSVISDPEADLSYSKIKSKRVN